MPATAKLFMNGRSQAVRLPAEFRFEGKEVMIRRDADTGEVILSPISDKAKSWEEFFALVDSLGVRADLLADRRDLTPDRGDPFER